MKKTSIINGFAKIKIDENYRSLCSRLHSAGHLVALTAAKIFELTPIKAHQFPNESYVKMDGIINTDNLALLENECNKNVSLDSHVIISENKKLRFVEFSGIGGYPCGGTHVTHLAEIGRIIINKISCKKGQTTIKYSIA